MASPLDSLKTLNNPLGINTPQATAPVAKVGGQLVQPSPLANLSQQFGRQAAPTTPLEAGVIGATPAQAKMAGTPNQTQNAIRQTIQSNQTLQTQQREFQANNVANAQELAEQQRQQQLMGLGSLQGRVQDIVTKMFSGQGAAAPAQALGINQDALKAAITDPNNLAEAQSLTDKMGHNIATNDDIVRLGQLMGYTQTTDVDTLKTQLKNDLLSAEAQAGQNIAGALGDTVTVSQLSPDQIKALGFTDINQMASLLKTDPASLQNMSVNQLQAQVQKQQLDDYSQVAKLQNVLNDPTAGAAQKQEAIQLLREKGAQGVGVSEAHYNTLVNQVNQGDSVQFMGNTYKVADLLNDKNVSGLVASYFTDPTTQQTIQQTEPEFASWIEQNRTALQQVSSEVDTSLTNFATIQTNNMNLKNTAVGTLNDATAQAIIDPSFGSLQAKQYTAPNALNYINDNTKDLASRTAYLDNLNTLANVSVPAAQDLANATQDQLKAAGFTSAQAFTNYGSYVTQLNTLSQQDPTQVINTAFGAGAAQVPTLMKTAAAMNASGLTGVVQGNLFNVLDTTGNGDIGNTSEANSKLMDYLSGGNGGKALTIEQMGQQGVSAQTLPNASDMLSQAQSAVAAQNSNLWQEVGQAYIDGNGKLTQDGYNKYISGNPDLSYSDIKNIMENGRPGSIDQGAFTSLGVQRNQLADKQVQQEMGPAGLTQDIGKLQDAAHKGSLNPSDISGLQSFIKNFTTKYNQNKDDGVLADRYQSAIRQATDALNWQADALAQAAAASTDDADKARKASQVANIAAVLQSSEGLPGVSPQLTAGVYNTLSSTFGINLPGGATANQIAALSNQLNTNAASGLSGALNNPAVQGAVAGMGINAGAAGALASGTSVGGGHATIGGHKVMSRGGHVPVQGGGKSKQKFERGGHLGIKEQHHYGEGPSSGKDTIPAKLAEGEFVMNKPSVDHIGKENLARMNQARYNPDDIGHMLDSLDRMPGTRKASPSATPKLDLPKESIKTILRKRGPRIT